MYELVKEFRSRTEGQDLPPSARLLYYELIFEFSESCWKTELAFSERELSILTGLSKTSINNAVAKLKEFGYIKAIQSHGRRTKFKITSDHFADTQRTVSDQSLTKKLPNPLLSIPKNQTQEVKILRQEDKEKEARAHARATDEDSTPKSQLNPRIALEYAEVFNLGQKPSGGLAFRLIDLQNKYGVQKMLDAIQKARFSKKPKVILEGEEKLPVIEGLSPIAIPLNMKIKNFLRQTIVTFNINLALANSRNCYNYLVSILEDKKPTKGASNYGERKSHHNADEHKSPYDDL